MHCITPPAQADAVGASGGPVAPSVRPQRLKGAALKVEMGVRNVGRGALPVRPAAPGRRLSLPPARRATRRTPTGRASSGSTSGGFRQSPRLSWLTALIKNIEAPHSGPGRRLRCG